MYIHIYIYIPYNLHPTAFILHPSPYTLHPTPYTLRPTPYALHPAPHTLHPTPYILHTTRPESGLDCRICDNKHGGGWVGVWGGLNPQTLEQAAWDAIASANLEAKWKTGLTLCSSIPYNPVFRYQSVETRMVS